MCNILVTKAVAVSIKCPWTRGKSAWKLNIIVGFRVDLHTVFCWIRLFTVVAWARKFLKILKEGFAAVAGSFFGWLNLGAASRWTIIGLDGSTIGRIVVDVGFFRAGSIGYGWGKRIWRRNPIPCKVPIELRPDIIRRRGMESLRGWENWEMVLG